MVDVSPIYCNLDLLNLCSVSLQLSMTEDIYGLLLSNLIHCIYFCILLTSIVFHIHCNEYNYIYIILCVWGGTCIYVPFKKWFRMQFETENTRIKKWPCWNYSKSTQGFKLIFFFMSPKVILIFNIVFLFTFLWCFWSCVSKLLFFNAHT